MKQKRKNKGIHSYHTKRQYAVLFFGLGCFHIVGGIAEANLLITIAGVIFAFIFFWMGFWILCGNKFLITPNGLEFVMFGWQGYTAWENIQELNSHQLKLKSPIKVQNHILPILGTYRDVIPLVNIVDLPKRFLFRIHWQKLAQTDFGRDLLHYAPHLFEGKLTEKAKVR